MIWIVYVTIMWLVDDAYGSTNIAYMINAYDFNEWMVDGVDGLNYIIWMVNAFES